MRVILAIDGSVGSSSAAQFLGSLLAKDDEVLLYYSPPALRLKSAEPVEPQLAERLPQLLNRAVFDEARKQLPAALQGRVREIVGSQKPAHGILVAADEYRADLIAIGARGAGPLKEPTVGSVARAVAHYATIPVLVVRQHPVDESAQRLKVLLCSDGSAASREAASVLARFTWPSASCGRVLTVVESAWTGQLAQWLEDWLFLQAAEDLHLGHFEPTPEEEQQAHDALLKLCGELPAVFQDQPPLVVAGHAREEILKAIESERANLVVVGARGMGATGRLLLGSTSEHLLMHAPCSILIIRQHERP